MIPRRAIAAALVAAVVIGAITLGAAILGAGGGGSALPNQAPVAATVTLDPTVVLFGDETTARIDIAVDRHRLDPDRIRIATDFRPFDRLGQHRTQRDAGRITYIREVYRLRCISRDCIQILPSVAAAAKGATPSGRRATTFRPASISYNGRSTPHPILLQWPTIESVTRVNQKESQEQTFFYHASLTLPPPSWAISPQSLLWLLFAAFLLALGVPLALAARRVRAWRQARGPVQRELPPLERALRLLEWANSRPEGEARRRALELVALELRRIGHDELVPVARELAWSPPPPPAEAAGELGTRVRTATGGDGAGPA